MDSSRQIEAVVIGASAGGVEALTMLLQALPADFAPAVCAVIHLAPDGPGMLPQLLGRRCALPVKEAEDKEAIEPGTVYFAVPDYHLLVEREKLLSLSREEAVLFSRPSIDVLFESAAYAYRDRLLGIILTGANMDGAAGLEAVRTEGGLAWVQDPAEAQARAMPAAAIAQAGADLVLPLKDMALRLSRMTRSASNHQIDRNN
ncbi:chemotaxis protein CheB [Noviherbaspirillum massiliense]|uniref:chemotaxis protein CheB n=1 Tax=Noviherbaspirillum massiliense TaxID=1465823 RepID=UPI00037CF73F|nr:chemotaxis protein CheB [Noviherbaspirillum massiliense]